MIIPSIDLIDGKAVQLIQGKEKVLERSDVIELAEKFNRYGEIAVIDLDAAFGRGDNEKIIENICKIADVRVGGGIRTMEKALRLISYGAKKIIIGTKADPEFLSNFNPDQVIVAIDTIDDEIMIKGWRESSERSIPDTISRISEFCSEFLFTDIGKEGKLSGISQDKVIKIRNLTEKKITFAGGITTIEDLKFLNSMNVNAQIGMSIYQGLLDLNKAFTSILDFEKCGGLIPTIVQNISGQVLMLSYSTEQSLKFALSSGQGIYFSRSRNQIWIKGQSSGNTQKLIKVRYDCDRDTLLFTVNQNNVSCHTGQYSCFDAEEFSINTLFTTLIERKINPKSTSLTNKLLEDNELLKVKILEESSELVNFTSRDNLVWEIADLTYFISVLMVKNDIQPSQVVAELWRRNR